MTSSARLAALDHREPDLVPIDFSDHRSSGVAAIVYPKQCECLGLPATTIRAYDPIQRLAIVDEDVLDRFGVDTIEMERSGNGDAARIKNELRPRFQPPEPIAACCTEAYSRRAG